MRIRKLRKKNLKELGTISNSKTFDVSEIKSKISSLLKEELKDSIISYEEWKELGK